MLMPLRFFCNPRRGCAECDFGGHALRMLAAEMAVNFEGQHSAIAVAQPAGDGWNINAAFDATRGKQVAQIVMSEAGDFQLLAS